MRIPRLIIRKRQGHLVSQSGMALLHVMITAVVVGVLITAMLPMIGQLRQNQKRISNAIHYASVASLVEQILAREVDCSCLVQGKVLNLSSPSSATLNFDKLKIGCDSDAKEIVGTGLNLGGALLVVESIKLEKIQSDGVPNQYQAELVILPSSTAGTQNFSPIRSSISIKTRPGSPVNASEIVGCGSVPLPAPQGLVLQASGSGRCRLVWSPVVGSGSLSYQVKKASSAGQVANGEIVCATSTAECEALGLAHGQTYFFAVKSLNATQESGYSTVVQCQP